MSGIAGPVINSIGIEDINNEIKITSLGILLLKKICEKK